MFSRVCLTVAAQGGSGRAVGLGLKRAVRERPEGAGKTQRGQLGFLTAIVAHGQLSSSEPTPSHKHWIIARSGLVNRAEVGDVYFSLKGQNEMMGGGAHQGQLPQKMCWLVQAHLAKTHVSFWYLLPPLRASLSLVETINFVSLTNVLKMITCRDEKERKQEASVQIFFFSLRKWILSKLLATTWASVSSSEK